VSELVKAAQLRARAAAADAPTDVPAVPVDGPAERVADLATGGVQMVAGRVSSGFGARWGKSHNGIDIAAPVGTPIHAPVAGEVIASGPASGFGLWVRVRHDDGTVTTYGHVNRSLVQVGEKVTAGEEIAEVGNRGRSTGPHLHMEVQTPGGTAVNPRPWLDGHGVGY
jgi:murein DD-endopeptidase MepM/ murein hydrolase activator NlpD